MKSFLELSPWLILGIGFALHVLVIVRASRGPQLNWVAFLIPVALGAFVFGVTALTGRAPSGLHVPNAFYWRSPDHYQQAMAHIYVCQAWLTSLLTLWLDAIAILTKGASKSRGSFGPTLAIAAAIGFIAVIWFYFVLMTSGWEIV